MNLGNGEYLVISNCIRMPYEQLGLLELLKNIESEIKIIDNLSWFDTSINSINYELVWNGLKNYKIDKFNYEDLIKFPLSSLDIKFNNGLIGRIQIEFLDKESYELSFITNYTEIFEESIMREQVEIYANYIEELAYKMFNFLKPIYGFIGVEVSCEGLIELQKDKYKLPFEKVYFSYKLFKSNKLSYLYKKIFVKNLIEGVFLRHSDISNYRFECSDFQKKEIYSILKF